MVTSSFLVLVGSFSTYISTLRFSTHPPSLNLVTQTASGDAPSWLLQSPYNSSIVYATDEVPNGHLNSLVLDRRSGKLTKVDSISTNGIHPTHIGAVLDGNTLGVANYHGSSVFTISMKLNHVHFIGTGHMTFYNGSGPAPQQQDGSHPHQILKNGDEMVVIDLGADKIWRMTQNRTGNWVVRDHIDQKPGSGPRHGVIVGPSLFTLCELSNNLTQHTFPPIGFAKPKLVASQSIRPPDTVADAPLAAAELLYAEGLNPLLYASNRNDPHQQGDAITIFETLPKLRAVKHVRTGLNYIRGMNFVGPRKEYIIAAGMNGGGIKVFQVVSPARGYLFEVAHLPNGTIAQPSSFIWTEWL